MKSERFAQDAAHFIKSLERMQGVLTLAPDEGEARIVLLSQPELEHPSRECVEAILSVQEVKHLDELASRLGARQKLMLDPGRLGAWQHRLQWLQRNQDLEAMIRAGHGALKRYQQLDLRAMLDAFSDRYTRLRDLQQLLSIPEHAPLAPFLLYAPWLLSNVSSHAYIKSLRSAVRSALDALTSLDVTHAQVLESLYTIAGFCGEEGARSVADETHQGRAHGLQIDTPALLAAACVPETSHEVLRDLTRCGDTRQRHWAAMGYTCAGWLFGTRAARLMIQHGCAELRARHHEAKRLDARVQQFLIGCKTLSDSERLGPLPEALATLRQHPHGASLTRALSRKLIGALIEEGIDVQHLPSQTSLWRTVQAAHTNHDPAQVGQVLWDTIRSQLDLDTAQEVVTRTKKRCVIALMYPEEPLAGLSSLDDRKLDTLQRFIDHVPREVSCRFIKALIGMKLDAMSHMLFGYVSRARALTPEELEVILSHTVLNAHAKMLPEQPKSRAALLRCVSGLEAMGLIEELDLENGWLVRLFASSSHDQDFNVLAIATALAHTQRKDGLASQIHAFCQATQRPDSVLNLAMHAWRTQPAWTSEEHAKIAQTARDFLTPSACQDTVDELTGQIARYFHHKRRLSEPEALSKNIVKKLRDPARGTARQIALLRDKIAREVMPETQRLALEKRIEALTHGEHPAARARRLHAARNLLKQSLAQLESHSLRVALDDALLEVLARITPRTYTRDVLTPELRSVIAVSQSEEFDPELFASFLDAALSETPRIELPKNRAWAHTMRHHKIDMARWEQGFCTRIVHADSSLLIKTEHDMMRAVQMGTWFGTCLSLEDGFHAMSALAHTLDANKHVVYVENRRGEVIARKLVGISAQGQLVGFPVYVREGISETQIKVLVDSAIIDFARACNLHMGNEGEPGEIHEVVGDGIYYDGVEPWHEDRHEEDAFGSTPETWGDSIDEVLEWALLRALEHDDVEILKAIAWRMRTPWSDYAVSHLLRLDLAVATRWLEAHPNRWDPSVHIAHALWRRIDPGEPKSLALFTNSFQKQDPWYAVEFATWNMPMKQPLIEQLGAHAFAALRTLERNPERFRNSYFEHMARNPLMLGHLPVKSLLELLDQVIVTSHSRAMSDAAKREEYGYTRPWYLRAMRISWLRHGEDERVLAFMLHHARHEETVSILAEFAAETPGEHTRRALWSRWKRADMRHASVEVRRTLVLALAAHEGLVHDIDLYRVDPTPRMIPDHDALHTFILEQDTRKEGAKSERRAVVRALESTQRECRASYTNQIDHPEVYAAFEALAKCDQEDVIDLIDHHAALCIIADESNHMHSRAMIHKKAREAMARRERGEVESLRYFARFVRGSREERITAIEHEIERFSKNNHPRLGAILWTLAGDLADSLTPESLISLAESSLSMNAVVYCMPTGVDAFLRWLSYHPDPDHALDTWLSKPGRHDFDDATDTGIVALINALDHEEEAMREIALKVVVHVTGHASHWGRAEVITHTTHRIVSEQGACCVEHLYEQFFKDNAGSGILTPEQWCALAFKGESWRDQTSMRFLQRLADRAARTWSQAQIEECTTMLDTHTHHKLGPTLTAYWAHITAA